LLYLILLILLLLNWHFHLLLKLHHLHLLQHILFLYLFHHHFLEKEIREEYFLFLLVLFQDEKEFHLLHLRLIHQIELYN
jgi:hypothetical protein